MPRIFCFIRWVFDVLVENPLDNRKYKNGCTFPFRQKPTVVHSEETETKVIGKAAVFVYK
nr:MAG TPA: hypothetical protein [Caudoviricetes sp.]